MKTQKELDKDLKNANKADKEIKKLANDDRIISIMQLIEDERLKVYKKVTDIRNQKLQKKQDLVVQLIKTICLAIVMDLL